MLEYREFRAESVSVGDDGVIEGLVTPFGRETVIGDLQHGGFREEVAPGTFRKTLKEGDPLMVWQHNMSQPLARASAGNLELREGKYEGNDGLVVKANPVDTSYAQDMRKLAKAKVLGGFSFGFNVIKDEWRDDKGNASDKYSGTHRILREVALIEVSPVTRPAYEGTILHSRNEAQELLEVREQHADEEARAPKPYGNVPYADPKNGKYPIDKEHVEAAWSYINQKKNQAKYPLNGVTLKSVMDRIRKAMKKFGHAISSEKKEFVFAKPEWRDDDPYLDDFYELDDEADVDTEEKSQDNGPYANLVAAILAQRDEPAVREAIDYCIALRDDPDGKEYGAIDSALTALRKNPPDIQAALSVLKKNQNQRDDPDGQEYKCIDDSIRYLQETPPDVKGAKMCLAGNQMYRRDQDQEPDTSTPAEDDDLALRMQMRSREIELDSV